MMTGLRRSSPEALSPIQMQPTVTVEVKGHVKYPGRYTLAAGSSVGDLLDRADPLELADLAALKLERRLRNRQTIHVSAFDPIWVEVRGAVQVPGSYPLPADIRLCHIHKYVPLGESADVDALKRSRRIVKAGDVLCIPERS
jgi:protein involved in polysaccharide export with SLBB domain